jgi:MFS family permease
VAQAQTAPLRDSKRLLGALRHRNYRLYFAGQIISTAGTWMQSVALPWLALQLTHNAFFVGLTLAVQFTPILLLGPFGGLVADRFPKRRVLLFTQSAYIVPATVLFAVTETHLAQYWMVLAAALAVGCVNVMDVPSRQAFVIDMVGREDLLNAIALNSTIFNASAVIGPSVAGLLIAYVGLPFCFLVNAVSFLAAILALASMSNLPALVRSSQPERLLVRLRAGLSYARRDPIVGTLLLNVAVFSLFSMNRMTLFPLFAEYVLHVGARGFGFLTAAQGLGALFGALTLALLQQRIARGPVQFGIGLAWCVVLLAFCASRVYLLSIAVLVLAGFCQISFVASANTRIQSETPDHLRGRVMALYAQALQGVGPIGSLQAGTFASLFGPPFAMAFGAVVSGVFLVASRLLRPEVFGGPIRSEA